jgi:hypothetical protein
MKTRQMRDDFQAGLERDDKITLDIGSDARLEIYICSKLKDRWILSGLGERLRLLSTMICVRQSLNLGPESEDRTERE